MTRVDALKILARAYWHIRTTQQTNADIEAALLLEEKFGYIRRSLTLADLKPCLEGFNGKGPTHL